MFKLHYFQHVPFEDLACIKTWAQEHGHTLSVTRLYAGESIPDIDTIDWLIIMGGPMSTDETDKYPWLVEEKECIKSCIDTNKTVLGICLGAQLIADVLGAEISRNNFTEIGWYPIRKSESVKGTFLATCLPDTLLAYHWHGDTFSLPDGAIPIASSAACKNQGFLYKERVLAFQCHMESTVESATTLIENCGAGLKEDNYVQTGEEMLNDSGRFTTINRVMYAILDELANVTHEAVV